MFHATMQCNLWDLVDEGIDDVLDRLKGEAGITGISVPLVCPPVEQLRPHKGVSPRTFRSRGGAQFQPHAEFYANTRLKPVVAEWLRKSNPLPAVVEACEKRGLALRGEIECCHSPALAARYPGAVAKDVFGDAHLGCLCPSNLDVVEFLVALVSEVTSTFPFESLTLDSLSFPIVREPRVSDVAPRGRAFIPAWLIGLCFCESCRQQLAQDNAPLSLIENEVRSALEKLFHTGDLSPAKDFNELVHGNEQFDAFGTWRIGQITKLAKRIREACKPLLFLRNIVPASWSGLDYERVADVFDGLFTGGRTAGNEGARGLVSRVKRVECSLHPAGLWGPPDSARLVRAVSEAVDAGAAGVYFDEYGTTPLMRLAWIKQAVRKAQRDVE